jgi:hypothetical protein
VVSRAWLPATCACFERQQRQSLEGALLPLLRSEPAWDMVRALLETAQRAAQGAAPAKGGGEGGGAGMTNPLAARQARQLFAAGKDKHGLCGTELFCGTDEDVFIEVIGLADRAHAAALRYEYATRFGHTLASAVRDETGGDLEALLLAFLEPPDADAAADAKAAEAQAAELHAAAKGLGTRTGPFVRIFGGASAAQLCAVAEAFARRFGTSLVDCLRGEFVFDLDVRKLLATRCRWARQVIAARQKALAAPRAALVGSGWLAAPDVPSASAPTASPPPAARPRANGGAVAARPAAAEVPSAHARLLAAMPRLGRLNALMETPRPLDAKMRALFRRVHQT